MRFQLLTQLQAHAVARRTVATGVLPRPQAATAVATPTAVVAGETSTASGALAAGLPVEVLLGIFRYLPMAGVLACARVCRGWHTAALDPTYARSRCFARERYRTAPKLCDGAHQCAPGAHSRRLYRSLQFGRTPNVSARAVDTFVGRASWCLSRLDLTGAIRLGQSALMPLRRGQCPTLQALVLVRACVRARSRARSAVRVR